MDENGITFGEIGFHFAVEDILFGHGLILFGKMNILFLAGNVLFAGSAFRSTAAVSK